MSADTRIKFTQPYAGWPKGAEHTVNLAVALRLERMGTAQIVGVTHAERVGEPMDSPEPTPATVSPEPGYISSEIYPGLRDIRGIGPAKELALNAAGIYTLAGLMYADRAHLDASLDGTTTEQIDRWIAQAYRLDQDTLDKGQK